MSQSVIQDPVITKMNTEELKNALKKQVEFYFSKQNLTHDAYLVSQMNSQMYVPLEVITQFSKVRELTDDVNLIIEALAHSKICSFNDDKSGIKPNIKTERNTIILREIPSGTSAEEVKGIFDGCGTVSNVRSDVGDTWFVTMENEDEAVKTLLALRSKTFNGSSIKARLKSESGLRTFLPSEPSKASPKYPTTLNAPSTNGYYQNPGPIMGFYAPNSYGPQYQVNGMYSGFETQRFRGNRPNRGMGRYQPSQGPNSAKDFRKSGSHGNRKNKDKRFHKGDKKMLIKKPAMNTTNFPPLSTAVEKMKDPLKSGFPGPFNKYAEEDIMEIVKNMSNEECDLPDGKMDIKAHLAALNVVAHADLLKSQRTYSIEQARDAMRQGRPIRSDSVGSMDYESMMYGEQYTIAARAERHGNHSTRGKPTPTQEAPLALASTTTTSIVSDKSEPQQEPHPKKVGYAAALLSSHSAPPQAAAATSATSSAHNKVRGSIKGNKFEKKRVGKGKKGDDAAWAKSHLIAKGTLNENDNKSPWGSKRSFLDVVKTENTSEHEQKPTAEAESKDN